MRHGVDLGDEGLRISCRMIETKKIKSLKHAPLPSQLGGYIRTVGFSDDRLERQPNGVLYVTSMSVMFEFVSCCVVDTIHMCNF